MFEPADITLNNVVRHLGDHRFTFNATIEGRAITAVTGRSGAGKTTLVNLIAGFEEPDSGTVLISGAVMNGLHVSRRPITLLFQENNLFAHLDVFTNVGLGIDPALKLDTQARRKVDEALGRVGLGDFQKRLPASLSGGERQRVAFARALVRNRPVLLLDEPFAALDPETRSQMGQLLVTLHKETGNTVVIVSHDPEEMDQLADHRLVVENGSISGRY